MYQWSLVQDLGISWEQGGTRMARKRIEEAPALDQAVTAEWANRDILRSVHRLTEQAVGTQSMLPKLLTRKKSYSADPTPAPLTDAARLLIDEAVKHHTLYTQAMQDLEAALRTVATPEALAEGALVHVAWREKYTLKRVKDKYSWSERTEKVYTGEWVLVSRSRDYNYLVGLCKPYEPGHYMVLEEGRSPADELAERNARAHAVRQSLAAQQQG